MRKDTAQMNEIITLAKKWMNDTITPAEVKRIDLLRVDPTWGPFARRMIRAATRFRREKAERQRERIQQMPRLLQQRREVLARYYENGRQEKREALKASFRVIQGGG